jgi:hypothetical protein
MRKVTLVLLALGLVVATTAFASNAVRISQVYGNGNNYYNCDYVELFNSSCAPVNIGGWSLQYGSATGTFGGGGGTLTYANFVMIPAGTTIPACGYFLMKGAVSAGGINLPVTPDLAPAATFNGSGTNGKFVLFSDQVVGRDCAAAKASLSYVDMVGYGSATCYEGAASAPVGTTTTVLVRAGGGLVDTDVNSADLANQLQPWPMHNSTGGYINPDCGLACGFGACCLRNTTLGACVFVNATNCQTLGGIFLGIGHACNPGECAVPTTKTSWGQVKTIYR